MSMFHSSRCDMLESFIRFREISGLWNQDDASRLRRFERYCSQEYPEALGITQKMVNEWCKCFPRETNNSNRARIYIIVALIRYLNERGQSDLIVPPVPKQGPCKRSPHPISQKELENFFQACDSLNQRRKSKKERCKAMVFPVFFRLLYSSGMRPKEARMLLKTAVDLDQGIMNIQSSKGNGQHYIVLHDTMLSLMRRYDEAITLLYPERKYFFPTGEETGFSRRTIGKYFRRFWDANNGSHAVIYDLRHNYAIENINTWTTNSIAFFDRLTYLSKSMGHSMLESTKYYYSLVPCLSNLLREQTESAFNELLPEVCDEES